MNTRLQGLGGKKSKGIPKEKTSRRILLPTYNNVKLMIFIANKHTFKTIQLHLGFWVHVDPLLETTHVSHEISLIRFKIKKRIREFASQTKKYKEESIVIVQSADSYAVNERRNYQYINVDITIFNKFYDFDIQNVKKSMMPVLKDIVDIDLVTDVFNIIKKVKGMHQYNNKNE